MNIKNFWEKRASSDAKGMYALGGYFENQKNFEEAFFWYNRAANLGCMLGTNAVAAYYLDGLAVAQDVNKAISLLKSIADKFPTAKTTLGYIYLKGEGCPQDTKKAMSLFRQAADSGDASATFAIGWLYLNGQDGVPVDYKKAIQWLEKAYTQEIYASVDILCDLYEGKYSRRVKNKDKYAQWSNVRKNMAGRKPNFVSEDNTKVKILNEADGRQCFIIDNEKVYIDFLIARTFVPNPYPDVYTEVEHIDGDMSNNAAKNLRWVEKK